MSLEDDGYAEINLYYPHHEEATETVLQWTDKFSRKSVNTLFVEACKNNPILDQLYKSKEPCTLYKPTGLSVDPFETVLARSRQWLREHHHIEKDKLPRMIKVARAFPDGPEDDTVHILIVTPEILESLEDVGDLEARHRKVIQQREMEVERIRDSIPAPSAGVKSFSGVQKVVNDNADNFHAGRPAFNHGPPVALFDPTLGLLAYHLGHLDDDIPEIEPDYLQIRAVHLFMEQALRSYPNEDIRLATIEDSLQQAIGVNITWKESICGIIPDAVFGGKLPYGVMEIKNEAGLEGDASLQAGLSYAKIIIHGQDKLAFLRQRSNYPAVLIGSMGDLLEFGIAVYTDGPYSDCVFSQRLRLDFHQSEDVLRVSRAFKAVQLALTSLHKFYARFQDKPPPKNSIAHLYPSPSPVPSYRGEMPCLSFTDRLSRTGELYRMAKSPDERRSGLYLATMPKSHGPATGLSSRDAPDGQMEVIIKFTATYNADAHRVLAHAGLAPALHACIPVCGRLHMVVMERVHGKMAWDFQQKGELLPYTVYADVKAAIDLLHQHDLVFGDLRTPNIMCIPGASASGSDEGLNAMLIDFDWAGAHGITRYPAILNDGLSVWALGMRRRAIMYKEHDLAMLERFRESCQANAS